MTEQEIAIINSIKKKLTCEELMTSYNLSKEELWNIIYGLKLRGFSIIQKYYYDGSIRYEFNKDPDNNTNYNSTIFMGKNDNFFSAILIADTHKGGIHESQQRQESVYNLCSALGVHIIIHCGDFIDSFINENSTINNYMENQAIQIEEALRTYPYDPRITNFICLGNHDLNALLKGNQNLALAFQNTRHDLVPIGWNLGNINVKSDKILVAHKVNKKLPFEREERVILVGHKHKIGYDFYRNKLIIFVPALDCYPKPILKLNLKMEKGKFISGVIEEYSIVNHNQFGLNNEIRFELRQNDEESVMKRTLTK